MSRTRFGVTRHTPNSIKGLIALPVVRLVLAFEAAVIMAMTLSAVRG